MTRDLAKHVLRTGLHSLAVLDGLIPLLKDHCQPAEFDAYLKGIASVSAEMGLKLFEKVFEEHPDLKSEMEDAVQKYGQFI